jgi:hypothetical protein
MPQVPKLLEVVPTHGSPLEDSLFPGNVRRPQARDYEAALIRIVGKGFRAEPADDSGNPERLVVAGSTVPVTPRSGCINLTGVGEDVSMAAVVAGGTRIRVITSSALDGFAAIGRDYPPSRFVVLDVAQRSPVDVVVPDTGDSASWTVRLAFQDARGHVSVCAVSVD